MRLLARSLSLCLFSSLSIARSFRAYFHALSRSVSLCFALFVILSSTTRRRRRFGAAQPKLIASVVRQPSPFSFRFVSRCISWRRHRHRRRRCVVSFRDVPEHPPSLSVVFVGVAYLGLGQRFALLGMCARALAF